VENGIVLSAGVIVGIIVTIVATILLCRIFPVDPLVEGSMIPHAISSPFAIAVAPYINGGENLAAVFSILTGIFGMLIGEVVLLVMHIKDSIVRGMMYGTTSSVVGTAKAMEIGQKDGVIASLAMILSGIVMILIAPILMGFKLIEN
ncbi:MAG: LrgB family protein, partial [Neisseriaceae bacterium]|nr:LrgB family protein [Neisseriaceae bacterium]